MIEKLQQRKTTVSTQLIVVWLVAAAMIPLSRLFNASLPSWRMFTSVVPLVLFLMLIAFGQGMVILSGGFDLSVAAIVTLGAYGTALLSGLGIPWPAACVIALALCSCIGLINGVLVAKAHFLPFVVTLATGSIFAAAMLGMSKGRPGQQSPEQLIGLFSRNASILGIPVSFYLLVVIAVICCFIQRQSVLGRRTSAVGSSPRAALLAGLPVDATYIEVYTLAGFVYGLAGILLLGYSGSTDLTIGDPWQMQSIAAVAIGGASMSGGFGLFGPTIGACFLLQLLSTDIAAAGLAEGWKQVLYGVIIACALLISRFTVREE